MQSTSVQEFIEHFDRFGGRFADPENIVDLGGPDGGRFWRVTSGHSANHPNARDAAVMARVTGSVGATSNSVDYPDDDVTVERAES